jgi:hypothetical protein
VGAPGVETIGWLKLVAVIADKRDTEIRINIDVLHLHRR